MSKKQGNLIADLQETFNNLRKYNMMLNPMKCVFGVPAGQLLGFIVSHCGIEVNPAKIKAILHISWPNDLKDVHRLTGCVAAMSRFIGRLGKKALPLYKLIKLDEFVLTDEADDALHDLKRVLSTAPVLAALEDQEPMLLYMAATNRVVSITLGPWEITYQRQSTIKSQVLPDFIAEWTEAEMPELPDLSNTRTIYVDGSKRVSGAGAGVILVSPQGDKMCYVLRM
jgi:hypothetical protein